MDVVDAEVDVSDPVGLGVPQRLRKPVSARIDADDSPAGQALGKADRDRAGTAADVEHVKPGIQVRKQEVGLLGSRPRPQHLLEAHSTL
jgi:hypothetical protein